MPTKLLPRGYNHAWKVQSKLLYLASARRISQKDKPMFPVSLCHTTYRLYSNGQAHPPGRTHRMNLGDDGGDTKPALEQYGTDLTAKAKDNKLDPVIGRDSHIQRLIQILSRRTKNNPVLVGQSGGKDISGNFFHSDGVIF